MSGDSDRRPAVDFAGVYDEALRLQRLEIVFALEDSFDKGVGIRITDKQQRRVTGRQRLIGTDNLQAGAGELLYVALKLAGGFALFFVGLLAEDYLGGWVPVVDNRDCGNWIQSSMTSVAPG